MISPEGFSGGTCGDPGGCSGAHFREELRRCPFLTVPGAALTKRKGGGGGGGRSSASDAANANANASCPPSSSVLLYKEWMCEELLMATAPPPPPSSSRDGGGNNAAATTMRGGGCSRGHSCSYSHTEDEVSYHPAIFRSQLCPQTTQCPSIETCPHAHNELELRTATLTVGMRAVHEGV
eukprot:GHVU01122274.1.p1 GENE.GHVU01122274.1~~GHVU01122274.1.p1  ORF type:complete len:180 (-),score=34.74 GHVU01122274.1:386-925(-)